MKHLFSTLVFVALFCLASAHVEAAQHRLAFVPVYFGSREEIAKIQDIEGTSYKLSNKYTLHFFIAGIYLSDDGYVLQDKNAFNTYYPLSEEEIKKLQGTGKLPTPLPSYSISIWAYLIGYSLWIIIAFAVGWPSLRHLTRMLMGKRFCPSCKLELTPYESQAGICGVCNARL